jgi:glycosyltransferase involved in cell wall biosynthesis
VKILHVIPSVGPLRGGPSFVIDALARGLASRGCEVHIATTDDNGAGRLSVPLGCPVPKGPVTYWFFPRQTRFYTFSWPLFRWLERHVADYDLVHIHALFSFPVIAAAWWGSRSRVPYVVRPLGTLNRWGIEKRRPWLKRLSLRFIDRPALSGAAAVHYTSEQEREEAASVAPDVRSVIIPNPVDFEFDRTAVTSGWLQSRYPQLAGKKIVLFLSRLDPKKGIDLLLSAFAKLRAGGIADTVLVLGGAGEEAFVRGLRETARRLGIEADVLWAGFLEGEQKKAALADAVVFVLPSYSENFGVAVAEAMVCGLPVIVTDQVGIHREISSAGAGLVVPCEVDQLADAIRRVLDDDRLRSTLAKNGLALAKAFTIESVTSQLLDLYQQIVPQPSVVQC